MNSTGYTGVVPKLTRLTTGRTREKGLEEYEEKCTLVNQFIFDTPYHSSSSFGPCAFFFLQYFSLMCELLRFLTAVAAMGSDWRVPWRVCAYVFQIKCWYNRVPRQRERGPARVSITPWRERITPFSQPSSFLPSIPSCSPSLLPFPQSKTQASTQKQQSTHTGPTGTTTWVYQSTSPCHHSSRGSCNRRHKRHGRRTTRGRATTR